MEWQPIETAPTDGTWIIGLLRGGDVRKMQRGEFYMPCWLTGHCYQDMNRTPETVEPTHWMPLPEPPNA